MSVTAPRGFTANGVACGIKPSGDLDLSLVATADGAPVAAAAVFTQNKMTAAPVVTTNAHLTLTGGQAAAVVLNSGCANAATGAQGLADAEEMTALVAAELGCRPEEVLVCSTGLISYTLPMGAVRSGVPALVAGRAGGPDAGATAAEAIRTTDTRRKEALVPGAGFTVGGMAKGAAMLAPNMATMLAVLATDAEVDPATLTQVLRDGVRESFNAMSVDGCTSTNDTVILLASGLAGPPADPAAFADAVAATCLDLATQMVGDAEGHTKVVTVEVTGALSDDDARAGARKVAESQLVKCSWYGQDPYWGRVASELGSAGIAFEADKVTVRYGDLTVAAGGVTVPVDETALRAYMEGEHLHVTAHLGLGDGRARVLTNDLTHAYVDENMGTS
ncbi:MAG TPA: bifunctional glutamate N-acetyltransferase/amino-acid acetyltransferase ArgJ [Acidimicrobiales bacterium]|nr:bifunctional glutamate N-acetyltransferase/amino-acid acetyltransferase ArgJ [Acidimicrobiales bacterium]